MMMEDDELLISLSALEHWSYCPRQCGLIYLENIWAESVRTAEGRHLHDHVDLPGLEIRPGLRMARALYLRSLQYKLVGRADMVYFYPDPLWPKFGRPFPVEYKRGIKNNFRSAELQLCGQAICLSEMLSVPVPYGAIYYGTSRRRREVEFNTDLIEETLETASAILSMLESGKTPPPEAGNKCDECSLNVLCMPEMPNNRNLQFYMEGVNL